MVERALKVICKFEHMLSFCCSLVWKKSLQALWKQMAPGKSGEQTWRGGQTAKPNQRVKRQNRDWTWKMKWTENRELLATYSCCYHAPCYYGVCDWATWGQASRWWALCPGPRRASCRRRPGTLPPAAEKPTYVCYLAMIAHRKQSLKSFDPKRRKSSLEQLKSSTKLHQLHFCVIVSLWQLPNIHLDIKCCKINDFAGLFLVYYY